MDEFDGLSVLPIPRLPVDVVRLLVEVTSAMNNASALALALSCRRFACWVTPVIYRSVNLKTIRSVDSFLYALEHSSQDVRLMVQVLTIDTMAGAYYSQTSLATTKIITLCINAVTIALWSLKDKDSLLDLSKHKYLRRVSIHMEYFMSDKASVLSSLPDSIPNFMFNITHLDLYEFKERVYQRAAILQYLHRLTHLFMVSASDEASTLASHFTPFLPSSTKVWIIHFRYYQVSDMKVIDGLAGGQADPRLVVSMKTTKNSPEMSNAKYIIHRVLAQTAETKTIWREWGDPFLQEPDFWEEAEMIIAQRKASKNSTACRSHQETAHDDWGELHW
ncbi:F-box domain-containing protein [Pleurotus pulmonarius]